MVAEDRVGSTARITWRTTLRAWVPCTRGLPLPTIAAALGMAAVPAAFVLLKGDRDLSGSVVAAVVIGAPAVAFAVEDSAGETLSASPTSLARRRSLRLSALGLALALLWTVLVVTAMILGPFAADDLAHRAAEAMALSGLAAAAGGIAHRQGVASPGSIGAVAGALCALMISSLSYRFHQLPSLMDGPHHGRWWVIAIVGWALAAWTWRDPARR